MKNFSWKIEYSLTILSVFTVLLFFIPMSLSSKEAGYISKWNEKYNKIEYMFTAMTAQADSDIAKELKEETDPEKREDMMIDLISPYLRLEEVHYPKWRYNPRYMNNKPISRKDFVYFETLYKSQSGQIVGIKDIDEEDEFSPAFIMSVDVNGLKRPNLWGRDIYGVAIFKDGKVKAIGYDKDIDDLRRDCHEGGSGVFCSHFYRIGGEFNE